MRCQRWKVMKIKTEMNTNKQTTSAERRKCRIPPFQPSEGQREVEGLRVEFVMKTSDQAQTVTWRDTVAPCHLSQIRSAET